jgi:prevent-host-death family protein
MRTTELPIRTIDAGELRNSCSRILEAVVRENDAILIARGGRPSAYLVAAERYEFDQRKVRILEAIIESERAVTRGEVVSHAEVKKRLAKWLK